jgi:hypothetical protein
MLSRLDARRAGALLLPYLALVLLHLLSGLAMEQPLILADELGYLGNARYLAGAAHLPDMQGSQFYHFGYSLFLVPAFWLFGEPLSAYRAALVVNALLAGSLFFPLAFMLRSFVRVPARRARWIAFACCLYPALLLYSSFAWSESAFIVFYALAAALFGRYLRSGSAPDTMLFSLVVGFLYTIHPRALPVVAAALAYLFLLAALRAVPVRQLLLAASTIGSVLLVTRLVNAHLKAAAWAGGGEVSATRLAERLLPDADFPALLERAAGQLLYLALATHGLFLVGLLAMLWLIVRGLAERSPRQVLTDPRTGVPLFILVTAAGVLAAACTLKLYSLHGPRGLRGADFIHGRYNEAFAVLAVAFAVAEICRRQATNRSVLLRGLVVVAVILCLTAVVAAEVDDALKRQAGPGVEPAEKVPPTDVDAVAVPGVFPLVHLLGGLKLFRITFVTLATFLTISVMLRLSRRGGTVSLVLLFTFFSYYNYRHYLQPLIARARPRLAFASVVRGYGPIAAISYDAAHREPGLIAGIQYLLQDTVFQRFDSRTGQRPRAEAVISSNDWSQARALGARFVTSTGRGSALWFLPGELQGRLPSVSFLGVTLGAEQRLDVQETGFYRQESFAGRPGRWTNGAATLTVPVDPRNPPRRLEVETLAPGRDRTRLQILANGVELWHRWIPSHLWSRRFSLEGVPLDDALVIELNSDTFSPAEIRPSSRDRRKLGIVVHGIRLTGRRARPEG